MNFPAYLTIADICDRLSKTGDAYYFSSEYREEIREAVEVMLLPQHLLENFNRFGGIQIGESLSIVLSWIIKIDECGILRLVCYTYSNKNSTAPIKWNDAKHFLRKFNTGFIITRSDLLMSLSFREKPFPYFWSNPVKTNQGKEFADAWHEDNVKRLAVINEDINAFEVAISNQPTEITHRRERLDKLRDEKKEIIELLARDKYELPAVFARQGTEHQDEPGLVKQPMPQQATSTASYTFRRNGSAKTWDISFNTESCHIIDCQGLAYIKLLLESPGTIINNQDIYSVSHPTPNTPLSEASLITDGLRIRKDTGRGTGGFDKSLMQRIDQAQNEYNSTIGDPESHMIAKQNLASLMEQWKANGAKEEARFPDRKKTQENVKKAIRVALNRIKDASPSLHDHLEKFIKQQHGQGWFYAPKPPVPWSF